jgi:hypothetical protein
MITGLLLPIAGTFAADGPVRIIRGPNDRLPEPVQVIPLDPVNPHVGSITLPGNPRIITRAAALAEAQREMQRDPSETDRVTVRLHNTTIQMDMAGDYLHQTPGTAPDTQYLFARLQTLYAGMKGNKAQIVWGDGAVNAAPATQTTQLPEPRYIIEIPADLRPAPGSNSGNPGHLDAPPAGTTPIPTTPRAPENKPDAPAKIIAQGSLTPAAPQVTIQNTQPVVTTPANATAPK